MSRYSTGIDSNRNANENPSPFLHPGKLIIYTQIRSYLSIKLKMEHEAGAVTAAFLAALTRFYSVINSAHTRRLTHNTL
jgi:hypothetical protein